MTYDDDLVIPFARCSLEIPLVISFVLRGSVLRRSGAVDGCLESPGSCLPFGGLLNALRRLQASSAVAQDLHFFRRSVSGGRSADRRERLSPSFLGCNCGFQAFQLWPQGAGRQFGVVV